MKKLNKGDRVILTKTVHPIKLPISGVIKDVSAHDAYFPYLVELDEMPNGYLSNRFWLSIDDEWEVEGDKFTQLELDFLDLMDNINEVDSEIYCGCKNPVIKLNEANFNTFKVCTICKKEAV